jgi:hypothetical protein
MPATPLTPTSRYLAVGQRKVYWVPTIANTAAPTRAELNAGTDLSAELQAATGWSLQGSTLDTPDMGTTFTSQVPGRRTSPSNDLTFYLDTSSNDVRSLLTVNANGFIVWLWEGDVTGRRMDVFAVRVVTQANDANMENAGSVTISFAVTKIPQIYLSVP